MLGTLPETRGVIDSQFSGGCGQKTCQTFLANPSPGDVITFPEMIELYMGTTVDHKLIKDVKVHLNGKNLDEAIEAIQAWRDLKFSVQIDFHHFDREPNVGTFQDETIFGMTADECYSFGLTQGGYRWIPSLAFIREIEKFFLDDQGIKVIRGHISPSLSLDSFPPLEYHSTKGFNSKP